jgi:hypothetical protein
MSLLALKQEVVVQVIASLLELSVTLFCVLRVLRVAIAQSQSPSSAVLLSRVNQLTKVSVAI